MESEQQNLAEPRYDRISNLPNDLIDHILSLLPTKYAVATSILSTTWKHHWKSITNLDFDQLTSVVKHDQTVDYSRKFVAFVNSVLLQVSCFHLLRIKSYDFCYVPLTNIQEWVSTSLSRQVEKIHISCRSLMNGLLPHDLFTSRTLVVLRLGTTFILDVPPTICLPSLKVVTLKDVMFLDEESLANFFSSCPVLEEIKIGGPLGKTVHVLSISALALKKLTLNSLSCLRSRTPAGLVDNPFKIVLNTPNLQYFVHNDYIRESYSVDSLPCLVSAGINVSMPKIYVGNKDKYENAMAELFAGMSNVQSLYLSGKSFEVIRLNVALPVFHNLSRLELGRCFSLGWAVLTSFLQSSPLLETVVFLEEFEELDDGGCHVPYSLLSNIKRVEINRYNGQPHELKLMGNLLKSSEALEMLTVKYCGSPQGELVAVQKLEEMPRASNNCRVLTLKGGAAEAEEKQRIRIKKLSRTYCLRNGNKRRRPNRNGPDSYPNLFNPEDIVDPFW